MQLSKRDFQKLSKKDQQMLASKKQQPKQKKNNKPKKANNSQMLSSQSTGVAAAYAKGVRGNKPVINYRSNGRECRVSHKEFVANVTGSVAFTTPIQLALNPGLATTFPWLSNIANNFETYRVNRMVFKYISRTGTNVPGSVLVYPDYDASDVAPISEAIASNYQEICEDAPWKDITCPLRGSGMHAIGPKKFVRATAPPANTDIKTLDVGTLFLSTVDGTAVAWGKLWVEYDVTFYEPQLNPNGSPVQIGGTITGAGTLSAANPLGNGPLTDASSTGFTVDTFSIVTSLVTATILVAGQYNGTVITAVPVPTFTGGAVLVAATTCINGAATVAEFIFSITVLPGSTIAFGGITATTVTASAVKFGSAPAGSLA